MKEFERVQIESRQELRDWLNKNYKREESIWLVSYKKHVPDKYVGWDEIVEQPSFPSSAKRSSSVAN